MEALPWIGRPHMGFAFWLEPEGCVGSEAIVYLPAYGKAIRQRYEAGGKIPLSRCIGEQGGDADDVLRIEPPTDDTIHEMIATLRSRVKADQNKVDEEIARLSTILDGAALMKYEERLLYMTKMRQLKERRANLNKMQPTFTLAKRFFLTEVQARITESIAPAARAASARMGLEAEVARELADLRAQEQEEALAAAKPA